jgi:hypothetical protein
MTDLENMFSLNRKNITGTDSIFGDVQSIGGGASDFYINSESKRLGELSELSSHENQNLHFADDDINIDYGKFSE